MCPRNEIFTNETNRTCINTDWLLDENTLVADNLSRFSWIAVYNLSRRTSLNAPDRSVCAAARNQWKNMQHTRSRVSGFHDLSTTHTHTSSFTLIDPYVSRGTYHEAHKLRWESSFLITSPCTRFQPIVNKSEPEKKIYRIALYVRARTHSCARELYKISFAYTLSLRNAEKFFLTKSRDLRFIFISRPRLQ